MALFKKIKKAAKAAVGMTPPGMAVRAARSPLGRKVTGRIANVSKAKLGEKYDYGKPVSEQFLPGARQKKLSILGIGVKKGPAYLGSKREQAADERKRRNPGMSAGGRSSGSTGTLPAVPYKSPKPPAGSPKKRPYRQIKPVKIMKRR